MRSEHDTSPEAAGLSAQREFERRHAKRLERAKARFGPLGTLVAGITADPMTIEGWQRGAQGELATARDLSWRLRRSEVIVIHDRRIPGSRRANIDHIAIGPGGVTVIDTKSSRGHVQLGTVGIINRREQLLVNGRDRSGQLDALERQIDAVVERLSGRGVDEIGVMGALCYPFMRRPFLHFGRAREGLIMVDDAKHVAKLANRSGDLSPEQIGDLADTLTDLFPSAT